MKARLAAVLIMVAGCGGGNKKPQEPTPPPGDMGATEGAATDTEVAEVKQEPPPPPPPPDTGGYKLLAQVDLQYTPLAPEGEGPEMAVVWGNPQEGPSGFFLRIPSGAKAGVHNHTAAYHAVVVSGPHKHWLAGGAKKAKPLEAGSYWFQPGGQAHDDECTSAIPCVLFIISEGKFDFAPDPKAKAPKVGQYKLIPRKDMKWAPMDPSMPDGPKLSIVTGDPKTGPVGFIIQIPPGGKSPIHSHSSDYHAVAIDGAPYHWLPHEAEDGAAFGNGTYFYQPGGYNHGDRCTSDTPCHAFVYFPKALDVTMAADPKAAK